MAKKKAFGKKVEDISKYANEKYEEISKDIIAKIDVNGDGKVGIEDMICLALKNKAVRVDRDAYLRKAFMMVCDEDTIKKAIETSPAKANIKEQYIKKAAYDSIRKQTLLATGSSVALGYVPGGLAVDVTTTVADVTQFYAHLLIIIQKLLYLYGFPELEFNDKNDIPIDDGTMNMLIICLGAMAGVNEACKVLTNMAELLAKGVTKKMMQTAMTKAAAWPVIKKILSYFAIRLTRDLATKTVANSIKVLGGILVGGITYGSFNKCGKSFMKCIQNSILAKPDDYVETFDAEIVSEKLNEGVFDEQSSDDDSNQSPDDEQTSDDGKTSDDEQVSDA